MKKRELKKFNLYLLLNNKKLKNMAITKIIYTPRVFANAAERFNFTTSYQGISNFAALIANVAGLRFVADDSGAKWENNRTCGKFVSSYVQRFAINADVYQFITSQIAEKINADFGAGVPAANSDAAFLATLFFNIGSLKTENWTSIGYTDAVTYYSGSRFLIPARFFPVTDFASNTVINGVAGIYGANSIVNGANTIKIVELTSFVNKAYVVEIFNYGADGTFNSLGTASGVVAAGGIISNTIDITYTPGTPVFFRVKSLDGFSGVLGTPGAYANVFKTFNLGYGAGFNGVNLELSIYDPNLEPTFTA